MRIVLYTSQSSLGSELFRYMHAHVAATFDDVKIVAVNKPVQSINSRTRHYMRKSGRMGLLSSLEIITSWPLQHCFSRRDGTEVRNLLRELPRPNVGYDPDEVVLVPSVNGREAVRAINGLRPSVIIQSGAGILRPQIFNLASIGTLNLHHGIAPLIRGINSIYWGLWEKEPQWIGATIHWIDKGIDTGAALAYCFVGDNWRSERFPSLYVRATEGGVTNLVETLQRLSEGERWTVPRPDGTHAYRSTFSGWKHLLLYLTDKMAGKR